MVASGVPVRSFEGVGKADGPDASFWAFARQVSFYASDRHRAFNRLKADWQRDHPGASHEEHQAMTRRLAELLGVVE
ncbi:MAG: hypothetical protein KF822_09365 [Steroidobacteraceae bacterium]|nr:hypothetical protein [Steroidobacteraceae bacterium]